MFHKSTCGLCDQQFLENEKRWKRFTIPVFTILTTLTLTHYPLKLSVFLTDMLYIFAIILLLWISNRFIIIRFHHKYKNDRNKKKKLIIRYILSIVLSLLIVIPASKFYHVICENHFSAPVDDGGIVAHRMLFLIAILFAYFINANYERMFLFVELTEKAVEAESYKKDSVESKFQNLKDKINPHFLFNTFTALSETIEEDPPKASELVQELADVYRYVLDNQQANWILFKKELNFASAYINLLKMRFEDNLLYNFDIPEKYNDAFIAPLSMQILIENAVKHNIISTKKPLTLDVFTENEYIIFRNNLQEKESIGNGTSYGLKNISERYSYLANKQVLIQKTDSYFIVKLPIINNI